ncbi:MAG: hypothetical protein ACE5F7_07280 [Nitrospiria bacterium]
MMRETEKADGYVYILSSLTTLNIQKKSVVFSVSGQPHEALIPLGAIKSYPDMRDEIHSEYFDFTVWGQMENYFNRDLEVIQKENRIIAILKELNAVNEKYRSLQKHRPKAFNPNQIVTVDPLNYFNYSYASEAPSGKENKGGGKRNKDTVRSRALSQRQGGRLKVEHSEPVSIRLKEEVLSQQTRSNARAFSENSETVTINTRSVRLSSGSKRESTWLNGLFEGIGKIYVYSMNNKIISITGFTLLFLFLKFILKVFMIIFMRA